MSLLKKLEEQERRLSQGPETIIWRPAEGEVLEGEVIDMGKTITVFGEKEYLTVQSVDGKQYMVYQSDLLARKLKEANVVKGSRVAIKFLGLRQGKKKRKYKDYLVVSDSEEVRG